MTDVGEASVTALRGRKARKTAAWLAGVSAVGLMGSNAAAAPADQPEAAQTRVSVASSAPELQELIVTAQKRGESVNTVPMSIVAATGEQMARRGITQVRDLEKLVPGFTYTDSQFGTPVYTLRGVGFSDVAMGGRPTVSIYLDEVPIPFSIETRGTTLDLERVEVLKGPQGTLFGQNSTGGAINYIAAKPTPSFESGLDVSYGRFNATEIGGFVSGPITDSLGARVALNVSDAGDWQTSVSSNLKAGGGPIYSGRVLLDWRPDDRLRFQLSLNGYRDKGSSLAPQLVTVSPSIPALAPLIPDLVNFMPTPANNRAADWDPDFELRRRDTFYQASGRIDYNLTPHLVLTSLTSASTYEAHTPKVFTGLHTQTETLTTGNIHGVFQELRVSGDLSEAWKFMVGVNYAYDHVFQSNYNTLQGGTISLSFVPLGLPVFRDFIDYSDSRTDTEAVFANTDYRISDQLKVYGGVRYTHDKTDFAACSRDAGDNNAVSVFGPLYNVIRGQLGLPPNPPLAPGACLTANPQLVPTEARVSLGEHNVSWRVGGDWAPTQHTLVYANVSKGYKAAGFPNFGATATAQYTPAVQEALMSYEVGAKLGLLHRTLQVNGAAFYYEYDNKQVLGFYVDPIFGPINRLVNVPHSTLKGAEITIDWAPISGLTVGVAGSYIDSKIKDHFTNFNANGQAQDFGGEPFPNTPKYQVVATGDYRFPLTESLNAFVGADVRYASRTNSQLGKQALTSVRAYTLVDLRAGVETPDGRWRLTAWGRNVGDTYYWSGAYRTTDTVVRFAGRPATFGLALRYRYP